MKLEIRNFRDKRDYGEFAYIAESDFTFAEDESIPIKKGYVGAVDGGWNYYAGHNEYNQDATLAVINIQSWQNANEIMNVSVALLENNDYELSLLIKGYSECKEFAFMLRDIADKIDPSISDAENQFTQKDKKVDDAPKVNLDTTQLDTAISKADELITKLQTVKWLMDCLNKN